MSERPTHLRAVSGAASAEAAHVASAAEPAHPPGLTPPSHRGRIRAFTTDVIVELGFVSRERAEEAVRESRSAGKPPERILVEQGSLDGSQLSRAVAERYGLDHVDLGEFKVDMAAANLIGITAARRYRAVPIGYADERTLLVAMADPSNVLALDDIQMLTGLSCRVAVADADDIEAMIGRLSSLQHAVTEAADEEDAEEEGEGEVTDMREQASDAPVIKLVYSVLGQAVSEGASDIHFEADEGDMRVRFRVDGVLYEAARVPKKMASGVVSRVKIMSDLDIAEKRLPQDGRVSLNVDDHSVDLRVTTLPTQRGEGLTVRVLDKTEALRPLADLGMGEEAEQRFESAFRQPYGAVLVTGPTGSGKSTTLYAALNELNEVTKNIITIEDPIEYRLPGINQMNVNRKAGLDFARGLRSILRADPDVIMVGEIRDGETARIAIESALTGHMMLSTLHTNDAPGAIVRLSKMGIETFLTASAVDCVVAQRLARRLCTTCKRRALIPEHALSDAGFRFGSDLEAYEPIGCGRCNGSGYKGRLGIFSVMLMNDELRDLAIEGAPESKLAEAARANGMRSLREDGLEKVRAGVTSIEEVARVCV
jgi:type IV pilus assembly protein PilB